ncbi:MAG TPA: ElyC/SanA/YdcF family protein [Pyrinomonadaceae bacterium]|nr:ElyC/SanA/YdcF family protein [Pyrinomonadaceae bacterium]
MFLFKKIIGPLLFPLPIGSLLLLVGLAMLWFTKKQKAGKLFVSAGAVLLLSLSFGLLSPFTLRPLERRYQPLLSTDGVSTPESPVKWIVVLGGGGSYSSRLPSSSQLSAASLVRLSEGIRLQRQIPNSKLLLSEGNVFQSGAIADVMSTVAQDLGVAPDSIAVERQSNDTESQAELIRPMVGNDRFILVTSASHMPRSMALFRKLGMNPIAAPTDFSTQGNDTLRPSMFYPNTGELRKAELAIHEYLGLVWGKLRGKL